MYQIFSNQCLLYSFLVSFKTVGVNLLSSALTDAKKLAYPLELYTISGNLYLLSKGICAHIEALVK
jgi:hypothetical protein